jgi:hypothetical protein
MTIIHPTWNHCSRKIGRGGWSCWAWRSSGAPSGCAADCIPSPAGEWRSWCAPRKVTLARTEERRLHDFDGRGYLSERRLGEFCEFNLKMAVDQLDFMHELLDLRGIQLRIAGYAERRESTSELPSGPAAVLGEGFLRREIIRGDVARIIGASPRTAQTVTGELLKQRIRYQ